MDESLFTALPSAIARICNITQAPISIYRAPRASNSRLPCALNWVCGALQACDSKIDFIQRTAVSLSRCWEESVTDQHDAMCARESQPSQAQNDT